MKQIYMHEVSFNLPVTEPKETMGLKALNVVYVSDKEDVEIFLAATLARKLLDEGSAFEHRVLMTGYLRTEDKADGNS